LLIHEVINSAEDMGFVRRHGVINSAVGEKPAKTCKNLHQNIPRFSEIFRFSGLPSARKTLSNFVRFCKFRKGCPPPVALADPRPSLRRLRPGGQAAVHSAARFAFHCFCLALPARPRCGPAGRAL